MLCNVSQISGNFLGTKWAGSNQVCKFSCKVAASLWEGAQGRDRYFLFWEAALPLPLFPTNHATDGTDLSSDTPLLQPSQSSFSAWRDLFSLTKRLNWKKRLRKTTAANLFKPALFWPFWPLPSQLFFSNYLGLYSVKQKYTWWSARWTMFNKTKSHFLGEFWLFFQLSNPCGGWVEGFGGFLGRTFLYF